MKMNNIITYDYSTTRCIISAHSLKIVLRITLKNGEEFTLIL